MTSGGVGAAGNGLLAWLKREEGFRSRIYVDTAGQRTIGYGTNLEIGISNEEAEWLLAHRVHMVTDRLAWELSWWGRLDEVRRGVLVAMAYQLGVAGLLKFSATLDAVKRGDYEAAARGMLKSLWAKQTPGRAQRSAEAMRTGRWPVEGP